MLNIFFDPEIRILFHSFQIKSQIFMTSNKVSFSIDTILDVTAEILKYLMKTFIIIINRALLWKRKSTDSYQSKVTLKC